MKIKRGGGGKGKKGASVSILKNLNLDFLHKTHALFHELAFSQFALDSLKMFLQKS